MRKLVPTVLVVVRPAHDVVGEEGPLVASSVAHEILHRYELNVAMLLARPAVLARIEKGEQPRRSLTGLGRLAPRRQTCIRRSEIVLLEELRLRLVGLGREDEVPRDDGKLVQNEEVRRVLLWQLRDDQLGLGIRERIDLLGLGFMFGDLFPRLLCKRRRISELELHRRLCLAQSASSTESRAHTGSPAMRRTVSSVSDRVKCSLARAASNLAVTTRFSVPDRPNCIVSCGRLLCVKIETSYEST